MTHTKDIYYKIHQHASPYFIHAENSRMVPYTDKYDKVGKKRLRQIHTRVNYLAEECGFTDKGNNNLFTYSIHVSLNIHLNTTLAD